MTCFGPRHGASDCYGARRGGFSGAPPQRHLEITAGCPPGVQDRAFLPVPPHPEHPTTHNLWEPGEKPANGVGPGAQPGRTSTDLAGQRLLGDRESLSTENSDPDVASETHTGSPIEGVHPAPPYGIESAKEGLHRHVRQGPTNEMLYAPWRKNNLL